MEDELWFKRQRLQDLLDDVLQEFEERNDVKVTEIKLIRLGVIKQIYSRVIIENKKDV